LLSPKFGILINPFIFISQKFGLLNMGIAGVEPCQLAPTMGTTGSRSTFTSHRRHVSPIVIGSPSSAVTRFYLRSMGSASATTGGFSLTIHTLNFMSMMSASAGYFPQSKTSPLPSTPQIHRSLSPSERSKTTLCQHHRRHLLALTKRPNHRILRRVKHPYISTTIPNHRILRRLRRLSLCGNWGFLITRDLQLRRPTRGHRHSLLDGL
jgi:hypothetical protein